MTTSRKKKLEKDDVEHFMENELYIPTRTIWIGPINATDFETNAIMAERAIKNLHILDSINDDPIEILMLNFGGEVTAGMAIYDAIMLCRCMVTIKVFGAANSMGSIILQAADKRLLAPNAEVMIHMGETGFASNHPSNIKAQHAAAERYDKWMINMYLDQMKEKDPTLTYKKVQNLVLFDKIYLAEEAVEAGLADSVMEIYTGHRKKD